MKVGIDCRLIDKKINSGISRYTEFLINYYSLKYGANNIVLISNDPNFIHFNSTVAFTRLKPYNVFHFFLFSKFVKKLKLDLIHIPFYSSFFFKINNLITIVTAHDLMYRLVDNFFGDRFYLNKIKVSYFNFIVKRSLKNADFIITVSKTTKKDIKSCFGFDSFQIPEDSSIDGDTESNILNRYKLKPKSYFFYCGNNRPHKNISFIKRIFEINDSLPILVLAGNGHKSSKNVLNLGIISEAELKALYVNAIAFIFPSKYEGFGLPILEAIRLKTIVIASRIPAFIEFKSKNIYYFDLDNEKGLLKLLEKVKFVKFQEDSFLKSYEKEFIYKLYDSITDRFKRC
jgi:hypothetical protein